MHITKTVFEKLLTDILVEYINGRRELIEIKPKNFLLFEINVEKFRAARKYCLENDINFVIISDDEIKNLQ